MQSDCIFCKIIVWEIPCYTIFENDYVFAFLDIRPLHLGHVLVVPKKHEDHFYDLDSTNYIELMDAVQILAPAIQEATSSKRVWVVIEWLEVAHAHIHLIPINQTGDLDSSHRKSFTEDEMTDIQQKIISNIE